MREKRALNKIGERGDGERGRRRERGEGRRMNREDTGREGRGDRQIDRQTDRDECLQL